MPAKKRPVKKTSRKKVKRKAPPRKKAASSPTLDAAGIRKLVLETIAEANSKHDDTQQASQKNSGEGESVTKKDLAKILGIAPETIHKWSEQGCPYERKGRGNISLWNIREVFKWYVQYKKNKGPSESDEFDKLARQEAYLAKKMKRMELEGQLVRESVVKSEIKRYISMMRDIGSSLERRFGKEALEILNDGLDEISGQIGTND